jgi:hypothetical protein
MMTMTGSYDYYPVALSVLISMLRLTPRWILLDA